MTPGHFNWFLHSMLFYHTRCVLKKQEAKKAKIDSIDSDSSDQENDLNPID